MQILGGIIRHLITTAGGGLLADGAMTQNDITLLSGAVATIIGVAWSIYQKKAA